ncbi:sigma 54 modulation/S30EA ribosomal C-terminal domain-containing protein [Nocardioides sp. NPDC051685]|uniref:sigma 54 modulation/S30EA ribosomal C-terminal domain-containing protein n=1 Tax=Nocardioides sp. NPDC051685 TaxID=3364334 RepID=UPI0037BA6FF2
MALTKEPIPVAVTLRGNVGEYAGEYARSKISTALGVAHGPVLTAHVVLDWRHNPAAENHAIAEASANVDGLMVRAKTAASTMPEAVDDLESRLHRQLAQLQDRIRTRHRRTRIPAEHQWRHGDLPRHRVPYFPRSEETREVVRHKSFASTPMTAEQAAYEMDLLDHDFFLYRDAASGRPSLVHHLPAGGYGVQGAESDETTASMSQAPPPPPPPSLTEGQARARLEAAGEPFVFYLDAGTGAGCVLYRRYDGHYGLIVLAD